MKNGVDVVERSKVLGLVAASAMLLASCGGSGGSGSDASEDESAPVSVRDGCVVRLRSTDIVPDMRLSNFGPGCDYYLDTSVSFNGDVVIEAGATVISGAGHFVAFEGGSLTALGSAAQPIVFRGEQETPGFWRGVRASALSRLQLENVGVYNGGAAAGQTSLVDSAALRVGTNSRAQPDPVATDVSMTAVTVSGSAADGLAMGAGLTVTAFSGNTFSGNAGAGVSITTDLVSSLRVDNDYLGRARANADPVIEVDRLSLFGDDQYTVPNLGVPIRFGSSDLGSISANGTSILSVEAGAEISMPEGQGIRIDNQAQFYSRGTAELPVTVSSVEGLSWSGIRLVSTREVVIENTVLGRIASVGDTFPGAIAVNAFPNVTLRDLTIDTTADWGVYCTRPWPTLSVSEISVFNAAEGAVHPDCGAAN